MKQLVLYSLLLVLLAACGPGRGKSLSDYPEATTGDSMMYYYAQLRAHDYWKAADKDTSLRNPEMRRLYLEGIKAGIDAVKMDSKYDAYNRGLRRGAQMAMRFLYFEDTYGIELNPDILIESLTYGLESPDNSGKTFEAQQEFYRLYDRVKEQHREANEELHQRQLADEAENLGMKGLRHDLFYKITKKGTGEFPHLGDLVCINVDYEREDGSDLGFPSPERVTVGAPGMPEVMEIAYMHLNKGASGVFATTAEAVFGQRAEILGMRPDDVLIVKITMNDIIPQAEAEQYDYPSMM